MPTLKIEACETEAPAPSAASSTLALAAYEIGVSAEDLDAYVSWVMAGAATGVEWFEPGMISEVA